MGVWGPVCSVLQDSLGDRGLSGASHLGGSWVAPAGAAHTLVCCSGPRSASKGMVMCLPPKGDPRRPSIPQAESHSVSQVIRVSGSCLIIKWEDIMQTGTYL